MENVLQKIKSELDWVNKIAIFWHENIDGDSIGGMLWLWSFLEKLWKNISYFTPYAPSKLYGFVNWIEKIRTDFDYGKYDLLIFVDFAPYSRIGRFTRQKEDYFNKNKIVIFDHHYSDIEYPNALLCKDEHVTSTCELIYETTKNRRSDLMDSNIATCFYLWLTTDSGNFVYDEDSKRTMKNAYELITLWADKKTIVNNIVRNKSLEMIKFTQVVLSRIIVDNWILYSYYENSELSKYNVDEEEADYAMNIIQNIDGPKVFILIRNKDKKIKVSLRSKRLVDCSRLASQFGWWWHKNASWFSLDFDTKLDFQSQIKKIIEEVKNFISK